MQESLSSKTVANDVLLRLLVNKNNFRTAKQQQQQQQ